MQPTIHSTEGGYRLEVAPGERDHAMAILEVWNEENPRPRAMIPAPSGESLTELALAYGVFLAILLVHLVWSADAAEMTRRSQAGSSRASLILSGEIWRGVTSLTLHKDLPHAIGNALVGGLFFGALSRRIGIGVALFAALASGAVGNLVNALWYTASDLPHNSVGASTAVFGIVGLLSGLETWRRRYFSLTWKRAWVPVGGGLALLAMLGSGGARVDLSAHVFGLLAGIGIGMMLSPLTLHARPGWGIQISAGFVAALTIALAWRLALP
jgi:rhomboid protease GluP